MFKIFDESLFREFRSSDKEALDDLGLDDEEIDKIEFEVSQSRLATPLRVDYSDFSNHVFFGSALASVNFALARILNDYPLDGELKEKNEWRRINSGFENYFLEEYPKQQGHFFTTTGSSSEVWAEVDDHEYKLRPGTGSLTAEMVVDVYDDFDTSQSLTLFSLYEPDDTSGFLAWFSGSNKELNWLVVSGASAVQLLTASFHEKVSGSHALSFVYDQPSQKQAIYVDGELFASRSFGTAVDNIEVPSKKLYIGAVSSSSGGGFGSYFTGAIDDFRFWVGPLRKEKLIKRNFFRPVNANHSGGLKLYYKFNETSGVGSNIFDYSGNEVHGVFSGAFSFANNVQSGTLGSWFKDNGDPIFDLTNTRVSGFMAEQRSSGSLYDKENRNLIYQLVPSFFIEDEEGDDTRRFLLMIARHYDKLKLYIDHLTNVYNITPEEFNNTPDELIGLVAQHFGMDLGSVYEGANALEFFFGEDVVSTGSLGSSVQQIRNQLRRNLLDNLVYIIKAKSTREALESSLRSLGLEENIININEYSRFSGGVETSRTPRVVERRVANLTTGSNVHLSSGVYFSSSLGAAYEFRVLFNTASAYLTSSLFTLASGSESAPLFWLDVERENLTSSNAVAKLYNLSSSTSDTLTISSSVLSMFDNNWINFLITRNVDRISLLVSKLENEELAYTDVSFFEEEGGIFTPDVNVLTTASLGSRSGSVFEGCLQEFRAWNRGFSSTIEFEYHVKDFDSTFNFHENPEIEFPEIIDHLKYHLKLNDFTGSEDGTAHAHDYVCNADGFSFSGLSSSAHFNFPGKYIPKLEPSYSYDFAINNKKIRIKERSIFTKNDITEDIPYLSVDISPAVSLNKEIMKWFGSLEKFNNLVGKPYYRYREHIEELNRLRYVFFNRRLNDKISFDKYLQLLKWFDSNFTFFLSQLLPLDLATSLSNFVVESHLLEYNQVPRIFPFSKGGPLSITGSITAIPLIELGLEGEDIPLGDPGRFGAATSASADVVSTEMFLTSSISGSKGVNFKNDVARRVYTDFLQENSGNLSPQGYGNGWITQTVTGSNYMKNVLNVNPDFFITSSIYLRDAKGDVLNTHVTGAFSGVLDARWLWAFSESTSAAGNNAPSNDFGIGYGGAWGQLFKINNKSIVGLPFQIDQNQNDPESGVGALTRQFIASQKVLSIVEETENTKTFVLWPNIDAFNPVRVFSLNLHETGSIFHGNNLSSSAEFWGDPIPIDQFNHINISAKVKRIVAGNSNEEVRLVFKFQFWNEGLPGNDDIEGVLSSSFNSGVTQYETEKVDNQYNFQKTSPLGSTDPFEFSINFEKELPKAKFMKTFLRVEFPTLPDGVDTGYKLLIKGTLHKETNTTQETLLKERT